MWILILLNLSFAQLNNYNQPQETKKQLTTPELSFFYYRTGYSVGKVGDYQDSFKTNSIGHRRYADEFFYGFELTSHFADKIKNQSYNVSMGYHLLTLRHKIKPYGAVYFGMADVDDKKGRGDGKGINLGLEVGARVWKHGIFSSDVGIRYDKGSLNNNAVSSYNHLDMFILFGFLF